MKDIEIEARKQIRAAIDHVNRNGIKAEWDGNFDIEEI